ncbi:MAG: ribosomal RNA small subunit methyltransferase A [Armatimonadetes bacterium Cent15-Ar3]|nr:MAG: ribosomal RNA small subunit methyltransferase A [Armatimonadetes bacterium Cent15-Ar3]
MNLADRGELVGFLRKHGISADKSLGQHFLCAPSVVKSIVDAAGDYRTCLEVGPGPGILTPFLAKKAETMLAVEFDERMIALLNDSSPTCQVTHGDALKVDMRQLLADTPEPRALVSNMPYYITGPLLERFAAIRDLYDVAVLMMQKEVGVKIVARPGERERGALSVMLQTQFEITRVLKVPAGAFMPPPKVESVVLKLIPRQAELPRSFERVVRAGHSQPRKTLINCLAATFRQERTVVQEVIAEAGLTENTRGFELDEVQWVKLSEVIEQQAWIESVAKG